MPLPYDIELCEKIHNKAVEIAGCTCKLSPEDLVKLLQIVQMSGRLASNLKRRLAVEQEKLKAQLHVD